MYIIILNGTVKRPILVDGEQSYRRTKGKTTNFSRISCFKVSFPKILTADEFFYNTGFLPLIRYFKQERFLPCFQLQPMLIR
jgi:hypothetical protein